MQLTYNGVALHALGQLRVGGESSSFDPPDLPRERRVRVSVSLDFFEPGWGANRAVVDQVRTALANPQAVLLWVDEASATTMVNQPATLVSYDLPEDPGKWGTWHQQVTLTFEYVDAGFAPDALSATYTPTGGSSVSLGNVTRWRDSWSSSRYSALLSQRSRTGGRISASGFLRADPTLSVDAQRSWLVTQVAALKTAANAKDGTLVYGNGVRIPFNGVVRLTAMEPVLDQAAGRVDWTLEAEYTLFPNESSYAMAEYSVRTQREREGSAYLLVLSGRVAADSRASADAKIVALRTAHVPAGAVQAASLDTDESRLDGPDGTAFVEVQFTESWRVAQPVNEVSVLVRLEVESDFQTLEKVTTLSGRVSALNRTDAETVINLLVGSSIVANAGTLVKSRRTEDRQKWIGNPGTTADDNPASSNSATESYLGLLVDFQFTNVWRGRLTGVSGVLECSVTEDVTMSGTRWVVRPTAYGRDIVQACGIQSGTRTVRAMAVAATETAALTWVKRQWYLPYYGAAPVQRYLNPPQFQTSMRFVPRTDGFARDSTDGSFTGGGTQTANCQVVQVEMSFTEILPTYDYNPVPGEPNRAFGSAFGPAFR